MSSSGEVCGSFGQTPPGELLVQALDRRWTGALELSGPWDGTVVEFVTGQPARVLVPDEHARLGALLVERGLVTVEDVAEAVEKPGFLLGEALVEAGKIEPETLDRALMLQVLMRMVRLFGKPEGSTDADATWRFVPDDDRFATMPPPSRVDSLRILSAATTVHGVDEGRATLVLALLDDAPLVLRDGARLERFAFKGEAQAVAAHIATHRPTYEALVAADIAPEPFCRAVVYLLATTRFLRQGEDAHASSRPAPAELRAATREEGSTTAKLLSRITLRRMAVARSQVGLPPQARDSSPSAAAPPSSPGVLAGGEDGAPSVEADEAPPSSPLVASESPQDRPPPPADEPTFLEAAAADGGAAPEGVEGASEASA